MVKSGVALSLMVVGALLVLIAVSGFTGYVVMNDSSESTGDGVTIGANVDNSAGEVKSVWGIIWDNTGGVIWQGLLYLVGGAGTDSEKWQVNVDINSPPFPEDQDTFDYTIYANDSSGEVTSVNGSFTINRDLSSAKKVKLKKGWNMISFSGSESSGELSSASAGEDREINLHSGWNLVGYSSDASNVKLRDVLVDGQGFSGAVSRGKIQNRLAYYDAERGSYSLVSESETFEPNGAYWVYSNSAKKMRFKGVGGAKVGEKIKVSDLVFVNEETGDGVQGLPGGMIVRYWNSELRRFDRVFADGEVNSWDGYFVSSPGDYSLVVE